jgi:flagellar biosynthetic protein FliR
MNELGLLTHIGLLLVRPGTLVATSPIFGGVVPRAPVMLGLTAMLALLLMPVVEVPAVLSLQGLIVVLLREFAIGLALGMSIRVLAAGAEMAGQLTGTQIGLSYASVVDPQSGVRNNLMSALYRNLCIMTFLAIDGHHAVVGALVDSYRAMPIGTGGVGASLAASVSGMLGMVFTTGLRVALPVIVVLLVAEMALGLVARVAPMLNLMVIGFPLRVIVGLVALAGAIGVAPGVFARLSEPSVAAAIRLALGFR